MVYQERLCFLKNALIAKGLMWSDGPNVGQVKHRDVRVALKARGRVVQPWTLYQWLDGLLDIPEEALDDILEIAGMDRQVWDSGQDGQGWGTASPVSDRRRGRSV